MPRGAPEIAEFWLFIQDTVSAVFFRKLLYCLAPLQDLLLRHEARALVGLKIEIADLLQRRGIFSERDLLPPRKSTEAVAVGCDITSAVFQNLRKRVVIQFAANDDDPGTPRIDRVRRPLPQILKRLAQIRQDQRAEGQA